MCYGFLIIALTTLLFPHDPKMDGCVFGWPLVNGVYHTGIMVTWDSSHPSRSIVCHFGLYGSHNFPLNLFERTTQGGKIETVEAAWLRWGTRPEGNTILFNERLRVDPERLKELKSLASTLNIRNPRAGISIEVGKRYSILGYNCQSFTRDLLPRHCKRTVVIQSDRPYVKANLPRLEGKPALPLRLRPNQCLIVNWTHMARL